MSWRLYAERLETADMVGTPRVYQPVVFSKNMMIKAFRTWIILYNSPVFSGLYLDLYSNKNSLPERRIHRCDKVWTLSEITTDAYAAKEIYFDFNSPLALRSDEYHLSLYCSGYTGNSSSHIAWVRGTPDPNNEINISVNTQNIARMPFYLGVIDGLR
jgi:hypothetical protein